MTLAEELREAMKHAGPIYDTDRFDRAVEKVVECEHALYRCRALFESLRGDWSDNRTWCREGMEIIDRALEG